MPRNLSFFLSQAAETYPQNGLSIYQPGSAGKIARRVTYAELFHQAQANSTIIHSLFKRKNKVVLLHFDNHVDNIIWFWSVVIAGYVPALSTPFAVDLDQRKMHLLHLQSLFSNPLILTSQRQVGEFCGLTELNIVPVDQLEPTPSSKVKPRYPGFERSGEDLAALMLTSGSTGLSKAVMLQHKQMIASAKGKSQYHETSTNHAFLNWIGFDHVASLTEIHLHAMQFGAEQIHIQAVDLLNEPLLFLRLISKHKVGYTFAPNFFLANLRHALEASGTQQELDLSSLRALISGGEANVVETCHALSKLLATYGAAADCIRPGFGMTETCAGSIYSKDCPDYDLARKHEIASLGKCIPGMNMRIVSPHGKALGPCEVGLLEVSGAVVFKGYYNNPSASADSFSKDGWFRTGDLAIIDDHGNLKMEGRAKETIIINGVNYYPQELEIAIADAKIAGLTPSYTAAFAHRPANSQTEVVVIVYLPAYAPEDIDSRVKASEAIARITMTYCGVRPYKIIPLDQALLPKTTLGKLSRAKLRKAFEDGRFAGCETENDRAIANHKKTLYEPPSTESEKKIMQAFERCFKLDHSISIDDNIFDVGATSIELLRLKSTIEKTMKLLKPLPISMLMTNATTRSLGKAIDELEDSGYDPVTVLQPHGSKAPLWLVHPGVGEVMIFMQLAAHITDRPVYALRAKGLDGEGVFEDIPEAVRTYHASIRRKQPNGPYAIAGYSYGSNLAFEVAKLIEAEGDEVKFLGAFDQPPQLSQRSHQFDWVECVLFVSFFTGLISEEEAKVTLGKRLRAMSKEDAVADILARASPEALDRYALTAKKISDWADVAFRLKVIGRDYDPSGTVATLDCLYAQPLPEVAHTNEEWYEKHLAEWKLYVRGEVGYHFMPGTHYDLLTTHVVGFQKKLKQVLEMRGI